MPSNSLDFNQVLNIAPSGHVQTIHNVIKDTRPNQKHQNHHQLQQEFKLKGKINNKRKKRKRKTTAEIQAEKNAQWSNFSHEQMILATSIK